MKGKGLFIAIIVIILIAIGGTIIFLNNNTNLTDVERDAVAQVRAIYREIDNMNELHRGTPAGWDEISIDVLEIRKVDLTRSDVREATGLGNNHGVYFIKYNNSRHDIPHIAVFTNGEEAGRTIFQEDEDWIRLLWEEDIFTDDEIRANRVSREARR